MDSVLKHLTGTEALVFIDDVIVYSDTAEEHAKRLANVLKVLEGITYNSNQRNASLRKTRLHN
jgi:hypothetical protein